MTPGGVGDVAAAPTRAEAASIAASAHDWLRPFVDRIPLGGRTAARALCQVLVGTWIADAIIDGGGGRAGSAHFPEIAHHVACSLNAPENSSYLGGVEPTLQLLVEVLLSPKGLGVEQFGHFLGQSLSVLRRPDPALEADPSLMEKRMLLSGAGLLPRPAPVSAESIGVLIANFRLSAPADLIDALTLQLECLTGWGTRPVDAELIAPPLADIVAGFAVQRLRDYELIPAARLLRLLEYLAVSGLIARRDDLYRGLCAQHRAHGPFGWLGPEAAELGRLSSPSPADVAVQCDLEFYLPTTLECLWTLAEFSMEGWRLFEMLPQYE